MILLAGAVCKAVTLPAADHAFARNPLPQYWAGGDLP
jgi:hypothetical protein